MSTMNWNQFSQTAPTANVPARATGFGAGPDFGNAAMNATNAQFYNNVLNALGQNTSGQAFANLAAYQNVMGALNPSMRIGNIVANQLFPEMLSSAPELASIGTATANAMQQAGGGRTGQYTNTGPSAGSSANATRQQSIAERGGAMAADAQYRARQQALQYYPQFAGAQAGLSQSIPQLNIDPNANLSPAQYQYIMQALMNQGG